MDEHAPESVQETPAARAAPNGTVPPGELFGDPTPAGIAADVQTALAMLSDIDIKLRTTEAMVAILIVSTLVLVLELELIRRRRT